MTPEDAKTGAAATASSKLPRLNPKLLIVGGGATLVLSSLVGAALFLLWPDAPAPARVVKPAKEQAAAAAPEVTNAVANAGAGIAAGDDAHPASAPLPAHDDGHGHSVAQVAEARPEPGSRARSDPRSENRPEAAKADASSAEAEAPMDRLQRRLAQVLGERAELDAARPGEWRLVAQAGGMASVAHVPPARAVPAERSAGRGERAAHWGYEGRGAPQNWGRLEPEFSTCAKGQRQSPIDIRDGMALDLEPLLFDYRPSSFGVIDTGHTVQVNLAPGNFVDINGRRFELQQFHFHRPSEERINGRQFDMNAHLVHRDADGKLAVLAVLLERGAAQPLLQTVWNNLPLEKGEEARARGLIDLNELLPTDRRYYTYMGSLTTPPCSEGVLWVVLQQPVPVSGTQIDIFSRLYPMNARPIQQAAGRLIKQSN